DCEFFITHSRCVHTMSLESILSGMTQPIDVAVAN
ncbi:MAG: hypothetical protein ACD_34C00241G0001, partial [uncultured bacterium]